MGSYAVALTLHLLGACVWVGGHLVLALVVLPGALRAPDGAERIRTFESAFERLGIPALLVQVVTGLWLASRLVPDPGHWLAPPEGPEGALARAVSAKLLLLAATAALAVHARLRLVPRLDSRTLPALAWHIRAVTALAVLFVLAGAAIRMGGIG